jgi:hypothetical protein
MCKWLLLLLTILLFVGCLQSPNIPVGQNRILTVDNQTERPSTVTQPQIQSTSINDDTAGDTDPVENALNSTVLIFSSNQLEMDKAKNNFWDIIEMIKPILSGREVTNYPDIFKRTWKQAAGIIIDKRGYILTSRYAIEDCDEPCARNIGVVASGAQLIYVFVPENGKTIVERSHEYIATVICKHPQDDLAIIKITPRVADLPILSLGDSATLKRGKNVLAIGYPSDILYLETESAYKWKTGTVEFNCAPTITNGIVSAKTKLDTYPLNYSMDELYSDYRVNVIQTNSELNWGNSGGPLIEESGDVIGVVVAKIFNSSGLGFAIEINEAKDLIRAALARPIAGIKDGTFLKCEDNGYCCNQTSWDASPARRCKQLCAKYYGNDTVGFANCERRCDDNAR